MARNDSRRSAPPAPRRGRDEAPRSSVLGRLFRRLIVWGFALFLLAAGALAVGVGFTAQSLPSFNQLKNTSVGQQMVVVRATPTNCTTFCAV